MLWEVGGEMAREIKSEDEFKNRILKLIPSEIIATYSFVRGVIPESESVSSRGRTLLGVTVLLAIFTIPTLRNLYNVRNAKQIVLSVASFVVWVVSIGDVVSQLVPGYRSWIGAMVLALWSFAAAVMASNYVVAAPAAPGAGTGGAG